MMRPTPKHKAPKLQFPLVNGNTFELGKEAPEHFTLIVFYRGLHCPVCKKYLQQLEELLPDFEKRGVNVVAVSMDSEKRARLSRKDWELKNLALGYDLNAETAKSWGLFMSEGIKDAEPDVFSEPGLFLIDNQTEVYYSSITSNPWGRPYLPSFLEAIDFILDKKYPARGELV